MNQEELRLHRCCFTGHRPDKMEFGEREIKPLLEKAIDEATQTEMYNNRRNRFDARLRCHKYAYKYCRIYRY